MKLCNKCHHYPCTCGNSITEVSMSEKFEPDYDLFCEKCGKLMMGISEEYTECYAALEDEIVRLKEATETHKGICALFGVPQYTEILHFPNYEWRHMATKIEIIVNGKCVRNYGGTMSCKACGFGVDMADSEVKECPKCEAKRLGITMDEWYARKALKGDT